MAKKGFTLIELLAVILILGIIALIAIPTVNNIINESKRGSFKTTVQNIAKAVEEQCQVERLRGDTQTTIYTFNNEGVSPSLGIKGKLPTGGIITVDNECNATINSVTDGKYRAIKTPISEELNIIDAGQKVCSATTGDGSNIGDEITCGTDSFYVYDTTGDNIKMLSKYNLKVGNIITYNHIENTSIITPYTESEITYMQDENMRGYAKEQELFYGTTIFSETSIEYSESIVKGYVNRYAEILTNMGMTIQEARLITKVELDQLVNDGNSLSNGSIKEKADALNRSWIYSTTYWSSSPRSDHSIWSVKTDGILFSGHYDFSLYSGVRPVIIIPKSEI